ncbi:Imm43 family immunity protein [Xenorhabdus sp. XENO-7]|uniref:Imm43 family immunity protein n=1 Tax=Xenorhabdus aichiensis TaxID=3025874 RepID=A0ABT5M9Z9_9GAMM|nr:Imm43 family immunity protein [Xenorhabdus aichiensis]MDC9623800.1 Imm43 family immunity protein [Xenorhabdus aichiensis]
MNYYMLMNDYKSSLIPRYLHAIVDIKKQVNENWDYEGSDYSFPYDMEQPDCPEQLFLLCNRNIGALKFNYYRYSRAHIMSDSFFEFLKSFRMSDFFCKKLLATSIKDGEIIRDDLNYMYFTNNNDFLDLDKSKLEEDRYRGVIPHKLVFNEKVLNYDIFSITGTLLSGHIFLSEMAAEKFFKKKIAGLKLIKLDNSFKEYCLDYGYDIELNRKRVKKKLP